MAELALEAGTRVRAPKASHMATQSGSMGLTKTVGVCSMRCWELLAGGHCADKGCNTDEKQSRAAGTRPKGHITTAREQRDIGLGGLF